MNKDSKTKHIIDVVFVLVLFAVFTASALVLVILGANVYRQTVKNMSACYNSRIATSYITQKIRQNDSYDTVQVGKLLSQDALIFTNTVGNDSYSTYIYCHDGSLRELFMKTGSNIGTDPLSAGNSIMDVEDFSIAEVNDNLLHISLTPTDGEPQDVFVSLHSSH